MERVSMDRVPTIRRLKSRTFSVILYGGALYRHLHLPHPEKPAPTSLERQRGRMMGTNKSKSMPRVPYFTLIFSLATAFKTYRIPPSNNPPQPRTYSTGAYDTVDNKLWYFGGFGESKFYDDLWTFDIATSIWTVVVGTTETTPSARKSHGSFLDSAKRGFYVFGGTSKLGKLNDMWVFSIEFIRWTEVPQKGDIPPPLDAFTYKSYYENNRLKFVIAMGTGNFKANHNVYVLDVETLTWTKHTSKGVLINSVKNASMSYWRDALYYTGGYTLDAQYLNSTYDTSLYKFEFASSVWTQVETTSSIPNVFCGGMDTYNNSLYLYPGWDEVNFRETLTVYKLDLTAKALTWVTMSIDSSTSSSIPSDSYSFVSVGSVAYFAFGWEDNESLSLDYKISNRLVSVDLNEHPLKFKTLAKYYLSPPPRKDHNFITIGHKIYMFGGEEKSSKLGDMWAFDTETEEWTSIMMQGTPPTPRSNYSACRYANNIFLFGGQGHTELYSDFYIFNAKDEIWSKYTDAFAMPSPRAGGCLVCIMPAFYLFGGSTVNGPVSEVWKMDLQYGTSTLLETNSLNMPEPYSYASCFPYVQDGINYVVVGLGGTNMQSPMVNIHLFDYTNLQWQKYPIKHEVMLSPAFLIGDQFMFAGGTSWGLTAFQVLAYSDLQKKAYSELGPLFFSPYRAASAYYKSSFYIHGGGDTFGLTLRDSVSIDAMYRIEFNEDCTDCSMKCSPGTFSASHGKCEPCPSGTYSSVYGATSCAECPGGTSNSLKGATSARQCTICPEGTYASETGSTKCNDCPYGYICSVRTTTPEAHEPNLKQESVQPKLYQTNEEDINTLASHLRIAIALLGAVLVLCFVFLPQKRVNAMKTIDIFKKSHNHFVDEVMYIRKKPFGGLISCLFMLLAAFFITVSLAIYFANNIEETKALVPMVTLENDYSAFVSDLQVDVFMTYLPMNCEDEGQCASMMRVTQLNLEGAYLTSCKYTDGHCTISYRCLNCQINSGAVLTFESFNITDYAKAVSVSVNSTSSIPGESSAGIQSLKSEVGYVLRGLNPSKLYFEMTPSLFLTDSDRWQNEQTGYHVSIVKAPVKGSETTIKK
mmetsp:Transcript_2025/g.4598  ORF Transcript_2025/g.4598 Transcript_2025/m.4598 type:complete len:1092 (+) Transcript_2025:3535-6810(+)